ncbi:hypothetical protein [Brachyspira aalborgi]|uniref:Lipoprotein n=1 Tax=Brachyspira aalborgi TaxID=29522 RepID=A0A5C8CG87_9SPIR|nr:hypothetical protein EPJ80_06630 [Brachyspira aalborgi]TXJ37910.1 hypothetical protein EPJ78_04155 [Brachyspira aalborgi]
MRINYFIILLTILSLLFILSCLPKPPITPAKVIAELELNKDITVYSNDIVDLDSPKVYNVNGQYYFGDFYYINNNIVYALDLSNSRIIIAESDNIKYIPLEYKNLEKSKISLIDNNQNIYITGHETRYIGNVVVSNITMSLPSESPTAEGDEVSHRGTYTIIVTNTNYTKVGFVSLNKISPEGKILYSVDSIIENEYESLEKLFSLNDDKFAVLKRDKNRIPIINIYDINTGKMENEYLLSSIEYADTNTMSYREIIDCVYIFEKQLIAILTMNIVNGKHKEDTIYTTEINNFNLKESYKIPSRDNSLAVGISSSGRVTYTGINNGMYFFIRTNPFLSQNYSKEYMGVDGLNKLRGINIFNDSIYGFLIENDKIKFQNY